MSWRLKVKSIQKSDRHITALPWKDEARPSTWENADLIAPSLICPNLEDGPGYTSQLSCHGRRYKDQAT